VGFKHHNIGTEPLLGIGSLSASNLIYASAFEAAWMFAWGLGFFGDFNFRKYYSMIPDLLMILFIEIPLLSKWSGILLLLK